MIRFMLFTTEEKDMLLDAIAIALREHSERNKESDYVKQLNSLHNEVIESLTLQQHIDMIISYAAQTECN